MPTFSVFVHNIEVEVILVAVCLKLNIPLFIPAEVFLGYEYVSTMDNKQIYRKRK